jgi:hypothetical protein
MPQIPRLALFGFVALTVCCQASTRAAAQEPPAPAAAPPARGASQAARSPSELLLGPAVLEALDEELSGTLMRDHVAHLAGINRIPASPGYHEAAEWVMARARANGLTDVHIESFPGDGRTWFGTLRGRLGYAFGNTLLYGTGGFAYGGVKQQNYADVLFSNDDTRTGWTAGAGIEYKVSGNWSLKGEYQYVDFGKEDLSGTDGKSMEGPETSFHTAKIGLNYRLGSSSSYEPLK